MATAPESNVPDAPQRRLGAYDMHDAARKGDVEAIKRLLDYSHKYANQRDIAGVSLLHRAAAGGHKEVVTMLLDAGADIDVVDNYGETPLKKAVFDNEIELVRLLLRRRAVVDKADKRSKTPLHYAAERGYEDCATILLQCGAEVNRRLDDLQTALHLAAANGHELVVRVLIDAKADLDAHGGARRSTPLHVASAAGHNRVVELLLVENGDPLARDDQDRTAIQVAKDRSMSETFEKAFTKNSVNPSQCTAIGEGIAEHIIANESISFEVIPRDYHGEVIFDKGGWLEFAGRLVFEEVLSETSNDTDAEQDIVFTPNAEQGCHTGTYRPRRAGLFRLEVVLDGFAIKGSPFRIVISPTIPDSVATEVEGEGCMNAVAGAPAEFLILARDRFGNVVTTPKVDVTMREDMGVIPHDLQILAPRPGLTRIKYVAPQQAGAVSLQVIAIGMGEGGSDLHLSRSPFALRITPTDAYGPNCEASGFGAVSAGVELSAVFEIIVRDRFGNTAEQGGEDFAVTIIPPSEEGHGVCDLDTVAPPPVAAPPSSSEPVTETTGNGGGVGGGGAAALAGSTRRLPSEITDYGNGTYMVRYEPLISGRHWLHVTVHGVHIAGSPMPVSVQELPEWGIGQVGQWITELGYPEHAAMFVDRRVSGFMLTSLTPEELERSFMITRHGHRNLIIREIRRRCLAEVRYDRLLRIDDSALVRLGMSDNTVRGRVLQAMTTLESRSRSTRKRDKDVHRLLRLRLSSMAQQVQEKAGDAVDGAVSRMGQSLMEKVNAHEVIDSDHITAAMRAMRVSIVDRVFDDVYKLCNDLAKKEAKEASKAGLDDSDSDNSDDNDTAAVPVGTPAAAGTGASAAAALRGKGKDSGQSTTTGDGKVSVSAGAAGKQGAT